MKKLILIDDHKMLRKGISAFFTENSDWEILTEAESLDEIDLLLHDICDNFADHQIKFENYREMIAGEKEKFDKDTILFLKACCSISDL